MKNIRLEKIYKLVLTCCVVMITSLSANTLKAGVYDYEYSLGIAFTTSKILGDNPAISTLIPINTIIPGGSFNGAMPGVEVKGQYRLDNIGDWRLVSGFNYTFYSAREKIPRESSVYRLTHDVNIFSPLVGINYTLFRFPSAMSSIYAGIEARYNYVHSSEALFTEESNDTGESNLIDTYGKESTGRLGSLLKIGLEGELHENYMINVSWGFDVLNALFRNNDRGQLLTPYKQEDLKFNSESEAVEDLTYNFYFSLMIQYRF